MGRWIQWHQSCESHWGHQLEWFQWINDWVYDLDRQECVELCDEDKIVVGNDIFSIMFWRGLEYYVDVDSHSVIELGTYQHPYKDLDSVFVEMLNLHSHTDRDIVVYIKEDTVNYLHVSQNYIVNINSVKIMTYSDIFSNAANRATIIGTDIENVSPIYTISTSFSILKSKQLLMEEKVSQSEYIIDLDKETINYEASVIMVINSNFTLFSIDIISDYNSKLSQYHTIRGSSMDYKLMNITNVDFNVSGYLVTITSSLDIHIQNSIIESTLLIGGFVVIAECNYPEAYTDSTGMFDNLTFYYTSDKDPSIEHKYEYIHYESGGMITFNSINSSVSMPDSFRTTLFTIDNIGSWTESSSSANFNNIYCTK